MLWWHLGSCHCECSSWLWIDARPAWVSAGLRDGSQLLKSKSLSLGLVFEEWMHSSIIWVSDGELVESSDL